MKPVFIHNIEPISNPRFIQTESVTYTACNKLGPKQTWERIKSLNTVHILINKTDSKELLLVKQVRIPVLVNNLDTDGVVIECCAGLIDKYPDMPHNERIKQIAIEEVIEETGYRPISIKFLRSYYTSVGSSGNTCNMFYAEVNDSTYVGQQLEPTEDIEVLNVPYNRLPLFLESTPNLDITTTMMMQWFILNKG